MKRIVVYKAVFRPAGDENYDRLYPPECEPHPDVDYVIFRDVPGEREELGWRVLPQQFHEADLRRRSRHHKCRPDLLFPESEYSLWVDGSLTPKVCPTEIVKQFGIWPVTTFDRIKRDCAYHEAAAMAKKKRDHRHLFEDQVARYHAVGYPRHHGLCATTAVLRWHSPAVAAFNASWWEEIERGCNRDQVSINFCLWQRGLAWGKFPGHWNDSPLFTWRPHYPRP